MSFVDVNNRLRRFDTLSLTEKLELLYVDYTIFSSTDLKSLARVLFNCDNMSCEDMVSNLIQIVRSGL